jgi:tetratricopeptide (TPR) repeat protein
LSEPGSKPPARSTIRISSETVVIALNNAAFALAVHLNKPSDALPLAQRAAALEPRSANVVDTLAWVEHLLGDNENAARHVDNAIRLDPRHAELRLHAAVIHAALGHRQQSDEHLNEALKLEPALQSPPEVERLRRPQ